MVEQIAKRIIQRIRNEVSGFIDESSSDSVAQNKRGSSEELISIVRDHLGKLLAEHHQTRKQLVTCQNELSGLQDKIELAISAARDDLARAALIRRSGLQRQIASLEARLKDIETESLEVEGLIEELSSVANEPAHGGRASADPELSRQLDELEALAAQVAEKPDDTNG